MSEEATIWEPVIGIRDIDEPFHSIAFAYSPCEGTSFEGRAIQVTMHGKRDLRLRFKGALALRFEDDCPGFDPLPQLLPMLREGLTFPLLQIRHSAWLSQWEPLHTNLIHFALLSYDDLVQLIAEPDVEAFWM